MNQFFTSSFYYISGESFPIYLETQKPGQKQAVQRISGEKPAKQSADLCVWCECVCERFSSLRTKKAKTGFWFLLYQVLYKIWMCTFTRGMIRACTPTDICIQHFYKPFFVRLP